MHQARHQVPRKRQKLMVRRPDTRATLVRNMCFQRTISLDNGLDFSKNKESIKALVVAETPKEQDLSNVAVATDLACTNNWNELALEPLNTIVDNAKSATKAKNPQCVAYIPTKGRQCARLAMGGNKYCYSHRAGKTQKLVTFLTPSCKGITVARTQCKHRPALGSSCCKKHWNQDKAHEAPSTSHITLERKSADNDSSICRDIVPVDAKNPLQVVRGDYLLERKNVSENHVYGIEPLQCIGSPDVDGDEEDICLEEPKWMENHKNVGYACAICFDSFTNKKMLVEHFPKRHSGEFVEQCLLLQCIPCGRLGNIEDLELHVLSVHTDEIKQPKAPEWRPLTTNEDSPKNSNKENEDSLNDNSKKPSSLGKFTCKLCGLKFNLLPDLGRHHQAAHMERNQDSTHSERKTGIRFQ